MTLRAPTSFILESMLDAILAERQITLDWLMERLGERSFGIFLLLLAILGLLPGVSALPGVLLMALATQMILAHSGPAFPRRVASRHAVSRG